MANVLQHGPRKRKLIASRFSYTFPISSQFDFHAPIITAIFIKLSTFIQGLHFQMPTKKFLLVNNNKYAHLPLP
jgi:hypothetical protein